jgi:hypothetical protein
LENGWKNYEVRYEEMLSNEYLRSLVASGIKFYGL